ncbi:lytic transglycosylase domain-containing protein [Anaeromicropila herbilytica]|uniref:Transglycosylase SLT domain-containing protein n=1 Tax=Anaeromicropila herbilytica TaxID=2785025 RepID=A0A7R7IEM8_9FIRM|nr:lytic transglycosylase domain-containing protein [Anaeromicropila herbilytica]BCN31268.1 hypothetical protein bsdtb5_25630 [Anaeromicropila herbilytica]
MSSINQVSNIDHKSNIQAKSSRAMKTSGASFDSYLGESSSMDKIFDKAAAKYNIPVELLKAVGRTESNFNAKAVSCCGAQGVMQLMPATARSLGVSDSFDAEQNIMGGAKYLSSLLKKYNGNTKLAVAAYNAGSGNVAKYGGIPPFKETQNYVKKVLGFMKGTDTSGSSSNIDTSTNRDNSNTTNTTNNSIPSSSTSNSNGVYYNHDGIITYSNDDEPVYAQTDDSGSLDDSFTYDDYLRFLTQFLEDQKKSDSENNSSYYASKQLSYSLPVVNLINSNN